MTDLDGLVLHRTTLAQQVAAGLSDRILQGLFAPGDRLREAAIAAELGVARSTVREAVRILELTGLVRHVSNRGAVVISPTAENVQALFDARERLETAAAMRVPDVEQLNAIELAFGELVEAADSNSAERMIETDLAFHAALVAILGSSRIDQFYAELTQELRFYLKVLSGDESEVDPQAFITEHHLIWCAIQAGELERAAAEVHIHIEKYSRQLQRILGASRRVV